MNETVQKKKYFSLNETEGVHVCPTQTMNRMKLMEQSCILTSKMSCLFLFSFYFFNFCFYFLDKWVVMQSGQNSLMKCRYTLPQEPKITRTNKNINKNQNSQKNQEPPDFGQQQNSIITNTLTPKMQIRNTIIRNFLHWICTKRSDSSQKIQEHPTFRSHDRDLRSPHWEQQRVNVVKNSTNNRRRKVTPVEHTSFLNLDPSI